MFGCVFRFCNTLTECMTQIWGFQQLITEVETVRREFYSAENPDHEEKLMRLWTALMPGIPLEVYVPFPNYLPLSSCHHLY